MAIAQFDDVEMYYEVHGSGQPLVLIAGFGADHLVWSDLLVDYTPHFKVILLDNRGVGRTNTPDYPYTIAHMADDIYKLCQHLNIQEAAFLGSSMGGKILQNLALRYPLLCKKAVITNSYIDIDPHFLALAQTRLTMIKAGADRRALIEMSLRLAFSSKFLSTPNMLETLVELNLNNPYPFTDKGQEYQLAALADTKTTPSPANISCPCLLLASDEDRITPVATIQHLAATIPHPQYHCFEGSGHLPFIEDKAQFNKVVLPFLL